MLKRKLTPSECRFVLWSEEIADDGKMEPGAHLHLCRVRFDGRLIIGCDLGQAVYETGPGYYMFPFLRWIAENAPICPTCKQAMYTEGLLTNREVSLS